MHFFSKLQKGLLKAPKTSVRIFKREKPLFFIAGLLAMVAVFFVWLLLQAPHDFPQNTAIKIEEGMTTEEVITLLKEEHVVRMSWLLQLFLVFAHRDDFVQANTYLFTERLSVGAVARAITEGSYIAPPLKITIPEGLTGAQMVAVIRESVPQKSLPELDAALFDKEIGYLFPETYYVERDFTQEELMSLMRQTFDAHMEELKEEVAASGLSIHEIVTLASIVEREASRGDSKPIVAGVLFNRLAIDMPLQVDAVFYYLLGKTSAELTKADLAMDSPYNTYKNPGLPPTPIANPGLESIKAVLSPTKSEHFYYLTAPDGTFHYAETFEMHKKNKERYLR